MPAMTKEEAIAWAGGTQEALANRLGIFQGSVSLWTAVPPLRQLQLEAISGGKLKADPSCKNPKSAKKRRTRETV